MKQPKVIVLSGYGLNCEEETAHAFNLAALQLDSGLLGGIADIVHINDLIANKGMLNKYQILAIPGGFSYGDDTGSGKAYANKLKNHLQDALRGFAEQDKLIIGICNGFQILTQTGLLPGALTFNDFPRYTVRWVDLRTVETIQKLNFSVIPAKAGIHSPQKYKRVDSGSKAGMTNHRTFGQLPSPWLSGITSLSLPIAHGEGKFYATDESLAIIKKQGQIAGVYTKGEVCKLQNLPFNPNGSQDNIAMITSPNGRILGTMPHPERAIFFTQLPHWTLLKEKLMRKDLPLPKYGPGLQIFKNSINYFN